MSIFDKDAAIDELEERMARVVKAYLNGKMPDTELLWSSLQAAEAEAARKLAVSLEPVEIFPVTPPTSDEITALNGAAWKVEPGYDMEGGMLGVFQWATIQLRHSPIIEIKSVKFVYPTINTPIYDVPLDWVYPDHKAGVIQFTPKPTMSGLAPSILAANVIARGGAVPQMVRIRYSAGLTPDHECMPEIIDCIYRMATLRHLRFLPQSGSMSADGLSQSTSVDTGKFREAIDEDLAGLKERVHGPIWGVLA